MEYRRKYKYGITKQDFQGLLIVQKGLCAICEKPLTGKISVDHNHTTNKVRGIVHQKCNAWLIPLENSEWKAKAERYLASHV